MTATSRNRKQTRCYCYDVVVLRLVPQCIFNLLLNRDTHFLVGYDSIPRVQN